MKFIASTAVIFSLLASSTLAADSNTNLRASSAVLERELPGTTTTNPTNPKTGGNTKDGIKRGQPSYVEFYNGQCVGFDQEKDGQQAKLVDCGDSRASYVVYRDDNLLEIYSNSNAPNNQRLCFEENGSRLNLKTCNSGDVTQRFFHVQQSIKGKTLYQICSMDNDYCLERKGNNAVVLDRFDHNNKDQLIILGSNFFTTK